MIDKAVEKQKLAEYIGSRVDIEAGVIDGLLDLFQVQTFAKGEYFARQGMLCGQIGYVIKGVFSMYIANDDGHMFIKSFVAEKQYLLASLDPHKASSSSISLQAITPSTIFTADYSSVDRYFDDYPHLKRWQTGEIAEHLSAVYKSLEEFATRDAKARYLLFLQRNPQLIGMIPQHVIACHLGVTPTQLSRIRKSLKAQ